MLGRQHPILTREDTLSLVEQLTSREERLVLQPGSYVRPLGSDTTIAADRGVRPLLRFTSSISHQKHFPL